VLFVGQGLNILLLIKHSFYDTVALKIMLNFNTLEVFIVSEKTTVLAVPCEQAIVLSPVQANEILGKIKKKQTTKKDKDKLEQDVKILFTKPDTK